MRTLEWALVLLTGAVAVPLFLARGSTPYKKGAVREIVVTAVPIDRGRLQCLLPRPIAGHRCAHRDDTTPWSPPPGEHDLIQPFVSVDRQLYLMAGLFDEANVRAAVRRRTGESRFTARCKSRLLERVTDEKIRFYPTDPWGPEGEPVWVVEVMSCKIE
jgi:hypothetical protein